MPKITVSIDGVVIKEIALSKARTTLGRRPYNDIVIDNLAVSGEHAVLLLQDGQATVEDLGSTNGTYVNGKAIKSEPLHDQDQIEIGRYKIRYELAQAGQAPSPTAADRSDAVSAPLPARIRVLDGPAAGREASLVKELTTLGKPGIAAVAIARRGDGYALERIEGQVTPRINGQPVGKEPVLLENEDLIELADTRMQFLRG